MPGYTLRFMKKRGIVQESGFEVGRLVKVFFFFFLNHFYCYFFLPKNPLCFIFRFRRWNPFPSLFLTSPSRE